MKHFYKPAFIALTTCIFLQPGLAQNMGIGTTNPQEKLDVNGNIRSTGLRVSGNNSLNLGVDISGKEVNAGRIGYALFTPNAVDFVGGGTGTDNRKIRFWAEDLAEFTGRGQFAGNVGIGLAPATSMLTLGANHASLLSLRNTNALNTGIYAGLFFGGNTYSTGIIQTVGTASNAARMAFSTGYSFSGGITNMQERMSIANTEPTQKLDIRGKLKLADDATTPTAGTVRWNSTTQDFEGYNGSAWLSLTKGKGDGWGGGFTITSNQTFYRPGFSGENFGYSIDAANGIAAVGSWDNETGGRVFVYQFSIANNAWEILDTLKADINANQQRFGHSVSVSAQYLVVGAPGSPSTSTTGAGRVHVFFRELDGHWKLRTSIIGTSQNEELGDCVAVNDAGHLIVGCFGTGKMHTYFIWNNSGNIYTEFYSTLNPPDASGFRMRVDMTNSYHAIVAGVGRVYVYHYEGRSAVYNFYHEATLTPSDGVGSYLFGASFNSGSMDGTPGKLLAVGSTGGTGARGKVYIYERNGTSWSQKQLIIATDGANGDMFGKSVSFAGDYLAVGASAASYNGIKSGKAYVFFNDGSTFRQHKILVPAAGFANQSFGNVVAANQHNIFVASNPGGKFDIFQR